MLIPTANLSGSFAASELFERAGGRVGSLGGSSAVGVLGQWSAWAVAMIGAVEYSAVVDDAVAGRSCSRAPYTNLALTNLP
jgi:hypothetical protein